MRKTVFWIGMLCLLTFSGCHSDGEDALSQALDFRAKLLSSGGARFTAQVSADYGEEVYDFTLNCRYDTQGQTQITVTAPESIEGISATICEQDGSIVYDGTELSFQTLAEGNVVPVAAPAIVASALHQAYVASAGSEAEQLRFSYEQGYGPQTLYTDVWLTGLLPTYAEIRYDTACILKLTITDFQFL